VRDAGVVVVGAARDAEQQQALAYPQAGCGIAGHLRSFAISARPSLARPAACDLGDWLVSERRYALLLAAWNSATPTKRDGGERARPADAIGP